MASVIVLSMMLACANAIPAFPGILQERQPDGSIINIYVKGNEKVHWRTDINGYPVVRDPVSPDTFVYAVFDNSTISMMGGAPSAMKPSPYVVGKVDPSTLGVPPNTPPIGMLNVAPPDFQQSAPVDSSGVDPNPIANLLSPDPPQAMPDVQQQPAAGSQAVPEMQFASKQPPIPDALVGDFVYYTSLYGTPTFVDPLSLIDNTNSVNNNGAVSGGATSPIMPVPGISTGMSSLPPTVNTGASSGLGMTRRRRQTTKASGVVQNLVLMIRFSDHRQGQPNYRALPTTDQINVLFNKAGGDSILAPTGSVRDVWNKNTYGKLTIKSIMTGWIDVPQTEIATAAGSSGTNSNLWTVIKTALKTAESKGLSKLTNGMVSSLKDFDKNNDGKIDMFTVLHSGYGAEMYQADQFGRRPEDRIWSHKWSMSPAYVSSTGVKIDMYHISSSLWSISGSKIGRIGVIAHETGHYLGLPDLYGTGSPDSGIGSYSLMANSWGFDSSQLYPPRLCAWTKVQLGVAKLVDITGAPGTYTVPSASNNPTVYRIGLGNTGEYLLIENRQPSGFDAKMPQGGLAIYHVDDTASFTNAGYPGQANWPANGRHYRVAMNQADNRYDMEQGRNRGDGGDVYHGAGVRQITPKTSPNTNKYQGGRIGSSNVYITSISTSSNQMTFRYSKGATSSTAPGISAISV